MVSYALSCFGVCVVPSCFVALVTFVVGGIYPCVYSAISVGVPASYDGGGWYLSWCCSAFSVGVPPVVGLVGRNTLCDIFSFSCWCAPLGSMTSCTR